MPFSVHTVCFSMIYCCAQCAISLQEYKTIKSQTSFSPPFLSIVCLKVLQKNCDFFVLTPQAFLSVHWAKSWGMPLRKHASAQVMGFRCGGLGSCSLAANNFDHLHSLHRDYLKLAVLQTAVSSGWKWKKLK